MRCPKCGFISFDQLANCVKCNKSFSELKETVQGTAFSVAAPAFLKIHTQQEEQPFGEDIQITEAAGEEFEVQDPDLDILFDGDDGGDAGEGQEPALRLEDDSDVAPLSEDFEMAFEPDKEEEEGIAMDLGQFQDSFDDDLGSADAQPRQQQKMSLDLPEELADISDLAPPQKAVIPPAAKVLEDDFDFSLDLDTDELKGKGSSAAKTAARKESFDLDEFDLSADVKPKKAARKPAAKDSDMDGELDFELDLGDLSLDKD